ncbi:hypothetical protein ANDA3_2069 [plant metagenome]|uniref:Uncharacterized protein n=1 Tax=plant metagenome TaxID=1297885 RepID=A0A484RQ18_9ZZZZ
MPGCASTTAPLFCAAFIIPRSPALRAPAPEITVSKDVDAMKNFLASLGLPWTPGKTQRAELKASYRIGNTRPLTVERTTVEFNCDENRPRIWVPEFARTSFHVWFEAPQQSFDFAPNGTMLKIRNTAHGNAGAYTVGLKPL